MLNGSVLSKHFWTNAVRIACYTQNRSIIFKRHDKTSYEVFRERISDISYFHVFGCLVFIHNHKDHLGKFDAKADDGYFLGYSFVSKAFSVYNTRRKQIEETYHVTFNENSDISYYIIPHGYSLTEITQENHIPEIIAPNEPEIPHSEDTKGPPDLINTEGTHEQNVQNDQMITQPTGDPGEGMLTRSIAAKLTAASASECLFADFLSEIEPKKVSEALKHPRWINAIVWEGGYLLIRRSSCVTCYKEDNEQRVNEKRWKRQASKEVFIYPEGAATAEQAGIDLWLSTILLEAIGIKITPQKQASGDDFLEIFQDDAKYEHVGQDTRSQDGKDNKDKQGKDVKRQ
ncbi:retrovirus-related pol polyprotein from transposon TNT 1-94 [Tanacetum coccineum]